MRNLLFRLVMRVPLPVGAIARAVLPSPAVAMLYRLMAPDIPDRLAYLPTLRPWLADAEFAALFERIRKHTTLSRDRAWTLYSQARQALSVPGHFYEAGVYRGGSALLLRTVMGAGNGRVLRLFDSFSGMPPTDAIHDLHRGGDFSDTSLDTVRTVVGDGNAVTWHSGWVPATFAGLQDDRIAFAHIDMDIHDSVLACCEFVYPRLEIGGVMVFDDYGFMTCPGARRAVDNFFADKPETPFVFGNGQAVVNKLP